MSEETKKQVLGMGIGLGIHNLILLAVCLIWFRDIGTILGCFLGALAAVLLLVSIAISTELCVEAAEEKYARKKMASHALIRSISVALAIIIMWKFTKINILTVVLGTLGLKTGAYLYPLVQKMMDHRAGN